MSRRRQSLSQGPIEEFAVSARSRSQLHDLALPEPQSPPGGQRLWRIGMHPSRLPRRRLAAILAASATLALGVGLAPVLAEDEADQPVDFTHNAKDAPAP